MTIKELVEKYRANRTEFLTTTYNETQTRNDFIDPFLNLLGWDVDNAKGKPHMLRDVIQEEAIEVDDEDFKKNPDYTLKINGTRELFIEVKKPSIDILKSSDAAFQTRRYGWSANLGVSILTNFENLVIYDCRTKPNATDDEHIARYKVYSFEEYETAFEEISELISYEAVNSGTLEEKFNINNRKGETFDEYFLQQIESWREKLAGTAIKNNSELSQEEVNFLVQRLLNRIIFLRICEDRTIIKYETIKNIQSYDELKELFIRADKKFNSGLFDFIEDTLSLEVSIDENILIEVFDDLYFPNSPYDFSVVDPTILSQIYESFLGRKIEIDSNRDFYVMETPEVSASNGVVPTPKSIVKEIVRETLTPLVEKKSLEELSKVKIADICCGSGTFLISVYDFLLEQIMEKVSEENIKDTNIIQVLDDENFVLTLKAKKKILENNLYGVDVNPYAVEVTEFSLLLKLLEDENEATIQNYLLNNSDKILPDLKHNIKWGNSLVDSNFYNYMPEAINNEELLLKVNPFDWDEEFKEIMEMGGFDAIVGNPPYVRIQNMKKYSLEEINYYQSKVSPYTVAKKSSIDKYYIFIQRALELLKKDGILGYIVPNKLFITKSGKELRKLITSHYQISKIIHFGDLQVFPGKSTYTAILVIEKNKSEEFKFKKVRRISAEEFSSKENIIKYQSKDYSSDPWIFLSPETEAVFNKFTGDKFKKLGELTDISVGLQTSNDKIYIFVPDGETDETYTFKHNNKEYEIEKSICRPAIYDLSFEAFETIEANAQMIFPYEIENGVATLIEENKLQKVYPLAWSYLYEYKDILEKRSLQGKEPKWYQFGRSQSLSKFLDRDKIVWSVLATKPPYALDRNNILFTGGGNGPYYGLLNESDYSLFYFLGILYHPVIESMVKAGASEFRGAYYSHGKQFMENLPIRIINFSDKEELSMYESIIEIVEQIIEGIDVVKNTTSFHRRQLQNRKIKVLKDSLIQNVNNLYGISEEELNIVCSDDMHKVVSEVGEDE